MKHWKDFNKTKYTAIKKEDQFVKKRTIGTKQEDNVSPTSEP